MSDIFASVLFVFFIYCAYCVAIYKPKPQPVTVPDPEQPIDYFPEIDEETDPEPQPIAIVERRPVAAFTAPAVNLNDLSIRQLKALAKERTGTPNAIKGYSRLTRKQLILQLS